MKTLKKALAFFLCMLMVLGVLSGCGKDAVSADDVTSKDAAGTDANPSDASDTSTQEATEETVSLERTEVYVLGSSYPCDKIILKYDKDGNLVSKRIECATGADVSNVADYFWEQTYDAAGNVLDTQETWDFEEAKEFFSFDPETLTFSRDREWYISTLRYDDMGRELERYTADKNEDGTLSESTRTVQKYDEDGRLVYNRYESANYDQDAYNYGESWSETSKEYNEKGLLTKETNNTQSVYNGQPSLSSSITTYTYDDRDQLTLSYWNSLDVATGEIISSGCEKYYYNDQGYRTLWIRKSNAGTDLFCYRTDGNGTPFEYMHLIAAHGGLEIREIYDCTANYEPIGEPRVVMTLFEYSHYTDELCRSLELGYEDFPLAYLKEQILKLPRQISFRDADGNVIPMNTYMDKPILLTIWTQEAEEALGDNMFLPKLQAAYEKYGDQVNFLIIHYSDDCFSDKHDNAVDYMKKSDYTFPAFYSIDYGNGSIYTELLPDTYPTTYFFMPDGTIQNTCPGVMDDAALAAAIEALLKAQ